MHAHKRVMHTVSASARTASPLPSPGGCCTNSRKSPAVCAMLRSSRNNARNALRSSWWRHANGVLCLPPADSPVGSASRSSRRSLDAATWASYGVTHCCAPGGRERRHMSAPQGCTRTHSHIGRSACGEGGSVDMEAVTGAGRTPPPGATVLHARITATCSREYSNASMSSRGCGCVLTTWRRCCWSDP